MDEVIDPLAAEPNRDQLTASNDATLPGGDNRPFHVRMVTEMAPPLFPSSTGARFWPPDWIYDVVRPKPRRLGRAGADRHFGNHGVGRGGQHLRDHAGHRLG